MKNERDIIAQFEDEGRVWFRRSVSEQELRTLEAASGPGDRPGTRIAGSDHLYSEVRRSQWVAKLSRIWPGAFPVRLLSFDKSRASNWSVPWHQDRVIAVRQRVPVSGFSNWSRKNKVWHCEPPTEFLDKMLFVRIHFDACDEKSGAMEIALGSHRLGSVASGNAAAMSGQHKLEICSAERGDILVLKMLTLHRSLPSGVEAQRRALRVDFALEPLPAPLDWS